MSLFIDLTDAFEHNAIKVDADKIVIIEPDPCGLKFDPEQPDIATRLFLDISTLDKGHQSPVRLVEESPVVVQSRIDAAKLDYDIKKEQALRNICPR